MNNDRRAFFGLLLRAGQEAVRTIVHEGVSGAADRLEITLDRVAHSNSSNSDIEPAVEINPPEPLTIRPVLWPSHLAQGFTQSLTPDEYEWVTDTELLSVEEQVTKSHLALLPLKTGIDLATYGQDLYLLGVVGPEPAALVSAGDAVNSWLDLMWNWAAISEEHPTLYPLSYQLSGGQGCHLIGCFGMLPEIQILSLLESGKIKAAVLSGEALTKALSLPGMRIAVDITAQAAAILPGAPWGPLTGIFVTGQALQQAPDAVKTLVEKYSEAISKSKDEALIFVPIEVCQPWVEALLGEGLLEHPKEIMEQLN